MRMKSSKYSECSQCIIFHSLISKFARYIIQILQIFRVKQKKKKKKRKKRRRFSFKFFFSGWKKGKSILWKLIETDRILEGLRGLEGINFSFFSSSSSFFLQLFSSNFFWQVEKEGEREEIPFNQKVASEDKVVLYRQREKCIAKLLSSQNSLLFFFPS